MLIWRSWYGSNQKGRFCPQKYLGDSVQLVHLVEVWNGFAKSSCLRLILMFWKIASGSYDCQVVFDAGSEKNCENSLRTETALMLQWLHKKTSPNPKSNVSAIWCFSACNFFSLETTWHLEVSTQCLNFLTFERKKMFLNLWKKKNVIDEELYAKFCPTVKVYAWFIKNCAYDSSADEIMVFFWDGKVAKV